MLGKDLLTYGLVAIGGNLSGVSHNQLSTIILLLGVGVFFWTLGDMADEERKSQTSRGGDPPRGN